MTEPNGTSASPVNGAAHENGGSVEPKEEKGTDKNRSRSRSRSHDDGGDDNDVDRH